RHRNAILEGLIAVANEPGGTAAAAQFSKEWKVAGKTGTAERSGREDDAWFVGFAPWNDPEVVVLVMLEGAGHGGREAGPLAREMFDYYFKNRARLTVDR
ncbi:MAG TPA: penicillin-binding transpeptidase domain-containing protein, partial [Candidatus Sumerlaeota bacterium]|nr:penicillin-binding transpeptidase domain-containing protein [Candidatus Sumerlaeota bacterium]